MRIDTHYLEAFHVVAEELHFRRASERLHMTQPALSRVINTLEDRVGVALLRRTTRTVELTEAGTYFLEESRQALSHLRGAVRMARHAAEGSVGRVRVAYMDFAINGLLPDILERCRARYPGISIELGYMPSFEQRSAVVEGKVDLAFMIGPFSAPRIETLTLERQRLVALLPEAHPLAARPALQPGDLLDQPFVMGAQPGWTTFRTQVFDLFHRIGATPRVVQEASTSDAVFGLVAAGVGISLYTDCVQNVQRRGLTYRYLDHPERVENILAWNRDTLRPGAEKLVTLIRELAMEKHPQPAPAATNPQPTADHQ